MRKGRAVGALCVVAGYLGGVGTARATVHVDIDLSDQRMHVESAEGTYDWPISSARSGFYTPGGSFAPTHLELMHYSRKYHMSPMPHAIFFRGGYAIHGTYSTASLGRPASHGCVRLSPGHATLLYNMVRAEGARISIRGTPPASRTYYARRGGTDVAADEQAYARPRDYRRAYYGEVGGYGYTYAPQPYGYVGYTAAPYGYAPQTSFPFGDD